MDYFTENALRYYGFDWAAMVTTFISLWLIGNKARTGFLIGIVANCFWFGYGFMSFSIANMMASCVVAGLQYRGWRRWGREADNEPKEPEPEAA